MAEASIPVDLFNPGQVFACLGFLEAADILLRDAEGAFDWNDEEHVRFVLSAKGERNPFEAVLQFLARAEARAVAPPNWRPKKKPEKQPKDDKERKKQERKKEKQEKGLSELGAVFS